MTSAEALRHAEAPLGCAARARGRGAHTAGVTQSRAQLRLRASPSSGALFSTELYMAVRDVAGLVPGLWHYDAQAHGLERLQDGPPSDAALGAEPAPRDAVAVVVVTAVFGRTGHKYRDRTYRYVCADLTRRANGSCTSRRWACWRLIGGPVSRRAAPGHRWQPLARPRMRRVKKGTDSPPRRRVPSFTLRRVKTNALTSIRHGSLVAVALVSLTLAFPTVEAASPYVHRFSLCRPAPPDEPMAVSFHRALHQETSFEVRAAASERLLVQAKDEAAIDAELFFLQLRATLSELPIDSPDNNAGRIAQLLDLRARGRQRFARLLGGDPYVRCAAFWFEGSLIRKYDFKGRFSDADRAAILRDHIAFLEQELTESRRVHAAPGDLEYELGDRLIDLGLLDLNGSDPRAAASRFVAGAKQSLLAAARAEDSRYVMGWHRYADVMVQLPTELRLVALKELLQYEERDLGALAPGSPRLGSVRLHVLHTAATAFGRAGHHAGAVSVYIRYIAVNAASRRPGVTDPDAEARGAIAYMLLGDTYAKLGAAAEATKAYQASLRELESASDSAREQLALHSLDLRERMNALSGRR